MKLLSLCPILLTLSSAELDMFSVLQMPAGTAQVKGSQKPVPPKVTFRLGSGPCIRGRLGNELFMYASMLGLMNRTGPASGMCVDTTEVSKMSSELSQDSREFGFEQFTDPCRPRPSGLACSFSWQAEEYDERRVKDLMTTVGQLQSNTSCTAIDVSVHGCLQSWKYFDHMSEHLRSRIGVLPSHTAKAHAWLAALQDELASRQPGTEWRFVGMQVRMGDKVHRQTFIDKYAPVEWSFYRAGFRHVEQALAAASPKVKIAIIVTVGGDKGDKAMHVRDRNVAQSSLRTALPGVPLILSPGADLYDDFALLKLMDAMVISTSTFGWWAAYLSKAHAGDGLVVMPGRKWRQDEGHEWGRRSALPNWKVLDNS